jgi:hypothetical protein
VGVDADLEQATQAFREFGARYYLARTLLERADRASDADVVAELQSEADAILADLRASRSVPSPQAAG